MRAAQTQKGQVIEAVRGWSRELPPGLATLRETITTVEQVLEVLPTNPRAAAVVFRIGDYGTMDIHFGRADLDEVEASVELAVQVCEAVRGGHIRETIRCFFTLELVSRTRLELADGRYVSDRSISPLAILLFPLLRSREVRYEAWST